MTERFKIELAYSRERVGIRVLATPSDWSVGTSANIKLTGSLSPDDAIAFADALRAKAEEVKAMNAKRDAAEQKRRERLSKLPRISLR